MAKKLRQIPHDLFVAGKDATFYAIKNLRTIRGLDLPKQSFEKENFAHLKNSILENYSNAKPVLLLAHKAID